MTLVYRYTHDNTRRTPVLTECPACGERFKEGVHRKYHLLGHSPEDFGLSPLAD